MNFILKVILSVLVGVLLTALLDHYAVLTPQINFILGFVAALLVYFNAPERL